MYDGLGRRGLMVQQPVAEKRIFNWVNEFLIPLAQNATIGVLFAHVVVTSPILVLLCAGRAAFQVFAGFAVLYVFVKYWLRSSQFVTEDGKPIAEEYEGKLCNSVELMEIAVGATLALVMGGVAWLLYSGIETLGFAIPQLNPWLAIVGIAQFPMSLAMLVFALLSFGQELVQRSPHMEMFVWKALGTILESFGMQSVRNWVYDPPMINYRKNTANDRPTEVKPRRQMTPGERQTGILVEFIRRGATLGYKRETWTKNAGIILETTGAKMTQGKWNEITHQLKNAGILGDVNGKTELLCSIEEALACISHPSFSGE